MESHDVRGLARLEIFIIALSVLDVPRAIFHINDLSKRMFVDTFRSKAARRFRCENFGILGVGCLYSLRSVEKSDRDL